jgi:NUMOD4 motif/HNH endonuclease
MCECTSELWAPVPEFVGLYEVSTRGQVRGLDRIITTRNGVVKRWPGRVLRASIESNGRPSVHLAAAGATRSCRVHTLVLTTFTGPCPEGMEGCHGDGDPGHNCVTNLRWDTRSNNHRDTTRHGRHFLANRTHCPWEHLLMAPNLVPSLLPYRTCLACSRTRAAAWHARKRGRPFAFRAEADRRYARIMGSLV